MKGGCSRQLKQSGSFPFPSIFDPCACYWIYPGLIEPLRVEPTPCPCASAREPVISTDKRLWME